MKLASAQVGCRQRSGPAALHLAGRHWSLSESLSASALGRAAGSCYVEPLLGQDDADLEIKAKKDSPRMATHSFYEMTLFRHHVHDSGTVVMATHVASVKAEFAKRYPTGESDFNKQKDTVRKAFSRAIDDSKSRGFAFETLDDGTELMWQTDIQGGIDLLIAKAEGHA
jgi:hypothetical protein